MPGALSEYQPFRQLVEEVLRDRDQLAAAFRAKPLDSMYSVGDRVRGEYEVRAILTGATGAVMLTWNHRHRRAYALKTLREELLLDPSAHGAFERECRLWISLGKHPYIVPAYFVPRMCGRLFVATECIECDATGRGTMLDHIAGTRGLPVPTVLTWAIQVCHAMEHMQGKGLVCHRDLKPNNIMIDQSGTARVTDFGSAKTDEATLTLPSLLQGTVMYMPPEALDRSMPSDIRRDVWSLGVTLFHAATGTVPWLIHSRRPSDWARFIRRTPAPAIPGPLGSVVARCLQVERHRRYPSFAEVRADLETLYVAVTGAPAPQPPQLGSETPEDLLNRAFSLHLLGQLDEAISLYRQGLDVAVAAFDRGRLWHNLGRLLAGRGQHAKAEDCYRKAVDADPTLDRPWIDWARSRMTSSDIGRASELLERGREHGAGFIDVWIASGDLAEQSGEWGVGLSYYEAAEAVDVHESDSWWGKGECLFMLDRREEAADAIRRSVALSPMR